MINIDLREALQSSGKVFRFEYDGMPELQEIVFSRPLKLNAKYSSIKEGIHVYGGFNTVIEVKCTRCLECVKYPINVSFDVMFKTTAKDDDDYIYSGESLELDKLVYDEIILNIPQQVLCNDDCKGICQVCGGNLNNATCDCDKKQIADNNNPFSKLKGIF